MEDTLGPDFDTSVFPESELIQLYEVVRWKEMTALIQCLEDELLKRVKERQTSVLKGV